MCGAVSMLGVRYNLGAVQRFLLFQYNFPVYFGAGKPLNRRAQVERDRARPCSALCLSKLKELLNAEGCSWHGALLSFAGHEVCLSFADYDICLSFAGHEESRAGPQQDLTRPSKRATDPPI